MAASVTINERYGVAGNLNLLDVTVTMDSSYASGGESVSASDFGLSRITTVVLQASAGIVPEFDYTNSKVIAYESGTASAALDECDAADDLSSVAFRGLVLGLV